MVLLGQGRATSPGAMIDQEGPDMFGRSLFSLSLMLALLACGGSAAAQDSERFTLERTEDGFVRLDTETGETSICRERGRQLVCELATEDRHALEDEIARLSERVTALEEAIGQNTANELPSEEEFNRTMGMMEQFFRRFFSIVEDLNRDFGSDEPAPAPDRT